MKDPREDPLWQALQAKKQLEEAQDDLDADGHFKQGEQLNPLAHYSTTSLKAELRRRKK